MGKESGFLGTAFFFFVFFIFFVFFFFFFFFLTLLPRPGRTGRVVFLFLFAPCRHCSASSRQLVVFCRPTSAAPVFCFVFALVLPLRCLLPDVAPQDGVARLSRYRIGCRACNDVTLGQ